MQISKDQTATVVMQDWIYFLTRTLVKFFRWINICSLKMCPLTDPPMQHPVVYSLAWERRRWWGCGGEVGVMEGQRINVCFMYQSAPGIHEVCLLCFYRSVSFMTRLEDSHKYVFQHFESYMHERRIKLRIVLHFIFQILPNLFDVERNTREVERGGWGRGEGKPCLCNGGSRKYISKLCMSRRR